MHNATQPTWAGLEAQLQYQFKDIKLLQQALTHCSKTNESKEFAHNERLEFLGDAVLEMIVSELLFERFAAASEGTLSRLRSTLVNETVLASKARQLELNRYLILGQGEEKSKGRDKSSILADAFEALVAALYRDGGFIVVAQFVSRQFAPDLDWVEHSAKEGKTALQEYCQKKYHILPQYCLVDTEGAEHDRTYVVEVKVCEKTIATGKGKSKKMAEQMAAELALHKLQN